MSKPVRVRGYNDSLFGGKRRRKWKAWRTIYQEDCGNFPWVFAVFCTTQLAETVGVFGGAGSTASRRRQARESGDGLMPRAATAPAHGVANGASRKYMKATT